MTPEVADVVQEIDAHRAKFETFCRSLTADELSRPVPGSTWQVRDFIAHLATIDAPVSQMLERLKSPDAPGSPTGGDGRAWDVDRWNDARVEERRTLTVEQLLAEAATERARMHSTLASLTDADVARTMHFGGDSKRPASDIRLGDYLRGWAKHDPIHVVDMLRGLPGRDTPEIGAWLDDPVIDGYQRAMNKRAATQ